MFLLFLIYFLLFQCKGNLAPMETGQDYQMTPKLNDVVLKKYCKYVFRVLDCTLSTEEVDVQQVFSRIKLEFPPGLRRQFDKFYWAIPIINGTLPADVFSTFTFKQLQFYPSNLEKIHKYAFRGCIINELYLGIPREGSQRSKLRNGEDDEYDLYRSMSLIRDVEKIQINLDEDLKHEIPENAFLNNTWNSLTFIRFDGKYTITHIENGLVSSILSGSNRKRKKLQLEFYMCKIDSIAPGAFSFISFEEEYMIRLTFEDSQITDDMLTSSTFDFGNNIIYLEMCKL